MGDASRPSHPLRILGLVQEEDNRIGNSCKVLNGCTHGNFQIKNEDAGGVCTSAWKTVETQQATLLMLDESECEPVRRINSELWGSLCFKVCLENCFAVLVAWLPLRQPGNADCIFPRPEHTVSHDTLSQYLAGSLIFARWLGFAVSSLL